MSKNCYTWGDKIMTWAIFERLDGRVGVLQAEHFKKKNQLIEIFEGTFDDACKRAKELEDGKE